MKICLLAICLSFLVSFLPVFLFPKLGVRVCVCVFLSEFILYIRMSLVPIGYTRSSTCLRALPVQDNRAACLPPSRSAAYKCMASFYSTYLTLSLFVHTHTHLHTHTHALTHTHTYTPSFFFAVSRLQKQ